MMNDTSDTTPTRGGPAAGGAAVVRRAGLALPAKDFRRTGLRLMHQRFPADSNDTCISRFRITNRRRERCSCRHGL